MSTITCQKIISCFETQLTETTTTLKLKVAPPPPPPPPPPTNLDFCDLGFLQTTPSKESGDNNKESNCYTYTRPWSEKSSFSRLSAKSLELCTENLGSETGTDIITDGGSIFSEIIHPIATVKSGDEYSDECCRRQKTTSSAVISKKAPCRREAKNFPPPLTTMSGSSSLQVRRRRDGGRLIIEAVEAPFRNSYLQVERSDGRLRLCFLTSSSDHRAETTTTSDAGEAAEEEEEIEEAVNEVEPKKEEYEMEKEMEKYQRRSRCNESGHGNKGLCSNWKPALWVATS